jgi:hypothetical protein
MASGAFELGNPEEADTEIVKQSEVLFDYRDSKITNGLTASKKNVAILNDTSQNLVGTVASVDWSGRKHLFLQNAGGTTGNNAGSLTWDIPNDSAGGAGSLNDYIWWRQVFWLGAANQYGFIKLTVSDTNGKFLYGVETFKRAQGLGCEYNFMASDGNGGFKMVKRWTFNGTHEDSQNPFNEPRGASDLKRNDDAKFGAAGLIMAILGGSVLPPLQASIIDMQTLFGMPAVNVSFVLPFICFVVMLYNKSNHIGM